MRFIQQTTDCPDLDVVLDGQETPAFRVLLPEWFRAQGLNHKGFCHVIAGDWTLSDNEAHGRYRVADELDVEVHVVGVGNRIDVTLTQTNCTDREFKQLRADFCLAANHLPGEPGWSNATFLPGVPLDRDEQGRFWFERVVPTQGGALTDSGWRSIHPSPDQPSAASHRPYDSRWSQNPEAMACAVGSPNGTAWLYQASASPAWWRTCFPANACMHMEPLIAPSLPAGATATLRMTFGLHDGDRASLEAVIRGWRGKVSQVSRE